MIKEWQFFFFEKDGRDNRLNVVKAIAEFWTDSSIDKLDVSGKCLFGGMISRKSDLELVELEIFPSYVKVIERIKRHNSSGVSHDLMRATTKSGDRYDFYSDTYNNYMALLLGDFLHIGKLDRRK